ncbi:hypothetical protein BH24ACT15_BH24ACT15_30350 [soil metagenome]
MALHTVPTLVAPDVLLAEVAALVTPMDAKTHAAKAEALRQLAATVDRSGELAREFAEVALRAKRRGGELLAVSDVGPGRKSTTLGDFGLTANQSSRWQRLASISLAEFDAYVAAAYIEQKDLTESGALKLARRAAVTTVDTEHPAPAGEYATIAIDPPWQYSNQATRNATRFHYETMPLDELVERHIPAADSAHLYLWATNGFLREAFTLVEAWGFTYKTMLTWCKPQIGMGNWFRNTTEHVLFAVKGNMPTLRNDVPTHFVAARTRHSEKPDSFYDLAVACSPGPRVDMFARKARLGWDSWGAESLMGGEA